MKVKNVSVGTRVEFRGNVGKVIEESDKSLTIYCAHKGRVPYTIGTSKSRFLIEGKIL
jgi:hypothetical protein